eukprot:1517404-Prymnesium_polylepis.1
MPSRVRAHVCVELHSHRRDLRERASASSSCAFLNNDDASSLPAAASRAAAARSLATASFTASFTARRVSGRRRHAASVSGGACA